MEASDTGGVGRVHLPAGVQVHAGHETSQTNATGQVVQGMVFLLTTPAGSTTSVFIPYAEIEDTAKVQATINRRLAAITAIDG